MKLKTKFILLISGLTTVILLTSGSLHIVSEQRLLKKEIAQGHQKTLNRLVRVCEESIYQKNLSFFNYLETLESERGFVAAFFVDSAGMIQMHSIPEKIGKIFKSQAIDNGVLDLTAPVSYAGSSVGTAHLSLSKVAIRQFLNQSLRDSLKRTVTIILFSILLGWLGAVALARALVKPIQKIVEGMRKVSKGNLEPISLSQRKDELGWLEEELNLAIQKLRESEDMKRNFFSQITHELRSPLSANQGFLMMLLKERYGRLTPEQKDLFLMMNNNGDRLMRLVDDLLTTSKLEAKKERLEKSRFDLGELMEEAAQMYAPLFDEKGLKFENHIPKNKYIVNADYDKVLHVASNLLSNGLKYTDKGSVSVAAESNGKNIFVHVADTGRGISKADQPFIFDRFHRSLANTKNIKGTGLGLHIVKSLVELHGGRVAVQSGDRGGTRFSFTLPKAREYVAT